MPAGVSGVRGLRFSGLVLFPVFLLTMALSTLLHAQAYFGTVTGEVTDASKALVPGVKLVLTDQQKGFTFTATSDNSGRYLFRTVPPGAYTLTAESKGFDKAVTEPFKVNINENVTSNLSLKVAGATQVVDVTGQAHALETQDAETGQVVNRRFINDLPLIDRNVIELTALAPGVTAMDDQCDVTCTGTNFVSNGSRGSTADILTDGASVTNSEPNGGVTQATYLPSPEAIEEFKVEQTNFSAEYGFSGGSVVNMVTRSGTNKFHGSAYDFARDQAFDANNWFNDRYGIPIAPLRRHNYGVTVGGPIIKNKTFFFVDYDGYRQVTMSTSQFGVPSDLMRAGDFGEVCTSQGGSFDGTGRCSVDAGQIWDPYSGTYNSDEGGADRTAFIPFNNLATYTSPGSPNLPANLQPPNTLGNLIDPVAQKMLSLFPEPNITGQGIYDNWIGSGPNHGNNDQFDIKVDHRFNEKNLMSVKYSYDYNHGTGFDCFKNFTDPCQGGPGWTNAHLFAINDTHTFSPTLLLNMTLGFTRGVWHIDAYNPHGVSDPLSNLGFPSYLHDSGFNGVPAIYIGQYLAGSNDGQYTGTDPYGNYRLGQDTGQLSATLDKVRGAHEFKFGFDGRIHQINYIQTNAPVGLFNFNEHGSDACPTGIDTCGGDSMASFLMGNMNTNGDAGSFYEIQSRPATTNYQYGFFGQDNWKFNSKLTLNLGLRYDVTLPRTDRHNEQNWFDPNVASPLGSVSFTDEVTGNPTTINFHGGEVFASPDQRRNYATDWKDFQPRIGFAYQFAPKMVLRGGYGIYYGQSRSGVTGVAPYGSQGFNQYTNVVTTYQNDGATPYLHLNNPFPNGLIQPAGNALGLLNDVGFGANGPLRSGVANRTPNEQSWSLGIERELPGNILINAEYIGKKGTHLPFSGANQLNILGPQIESPSADIGGLNTFVDNPLSSQLGGPISDPNSPLSAPTVQEFQLQLPYPQFTGVSNDVQMIASSSYNALQLTAEKRYSNGLQLLVTYVWSKSIDDSSQADDNVTWLGSATSLQDPNKPWLERSLSTFDIPQVLQISYSYDLPFGRHRAFLANMPRFLEGVIGGWKTNGVWRLSAGRPLAFTLADGNNLPTYGTQRPNIVGTPRRNNGPDWVDQYFADVNVFQRPDDFTLGNAPRALGSIRSPRSFTTDLSIGKQFSLASIREDMNLEFRLEAKNAFNHPVFSAPNTSVDDPSFGQITQLSVGPREMQLAIKFNF